MRFFLRLCAVVVLTVSARADADVSAATPATPETLWPDTTPGLRRELAFELRMRVRCEIDGDAEGERFLRKEFARDPRMEVKAFMARMCFVGDTWGMKSLVDHARGRVLAEQAIAEGSAMALEVLGVAISEGKVEGVTPDKSIPYFLRGCELGVPRCLARIGWFSVTGWNVRVNHLLGIQLANRAAQLGNPGGLLDVGLAYEKGDAPGGASAFMAIEFLRQARRHGSGGADEELQRLAKDNAQARLVLSVERARAANEGRWMMLKTGKRRIEELAALRSEDPAAIAELGIAHVDGYYAKRDIPRAKQLLESAAKRGNTDARFELARMRAEGIGGPRDLAALDEIRVLADLGNSRAATYYGYAHHWGSSVVKGLEKNDEIAFRYTRRGAQLGEVFGLWNLGVYYEDGVGTKPDSLLAAKCFWEAYKLGVIDGLEKARRHLAFVKE